KLARRAPGTMPRWLLNPSGCGDDLASIGCWVAVALLIAGVEIPLVVHGLIGAGVALWLGFISFFVIGVLLELFFIEPCRTIERKVRAIARRTEAAVTPSAQNPDAAQELA